MKYIPILFSGPMVRAILEGRKTQTRRVIKPQPPEWDWTRVKEYAEVRGLTQKVGNTDYWIKPCPYGQPGHRLWVRETWRAEELESGLDGVRYAADNHFQPIENTPEAADAWGNAHFNKHGKPYGVLAWRPSIFMPRWASRLTLEVVSVRVERVQDITQGDALAEGVTRHLRSEFGYSAEVSEETFNFTQARSIYKLLWDQINSSRGFGWDINPWVWMIEFKRL